MRIMLFCLMTTLLLFLCSCGGDHHDPADIKEPKCIIHIPAMDIYVAEDCINNDGLAWIYDRKICVKGKFLADGMVDPDDETLGHEVQHMMRVHNRHIVDPDK
jgi:hypothetical protein